LAAMLAAGFAAMCGSGNAPVFAMEQEPAHACGGGEIARGTVSRIVDGRTFVLDNGREIRLAAIEVPPVPLPQDDWSKLTLQSERIQRVPAGNAVVPLDQANPV
jgi:endonuclease YncB( thermonuclease family)